MERAGPEVAGTSMALDQPSTGLSIAQPAGNSRIDVEPGPMSAAFRGLEDLIEGKRPEGDLETHGRTQQAHASRLHINASDRHFKE